MADNSHALRKMRQRLVRRPAFSLSDAINQAEMLQDTEPDQIVVSVPLVLGLVLETEDCEIPGCPCKR